jgi:3-hydroxyisobutyrate dehydrogenase
MKVAFIGLGTMGEPMAGRLLDAGYDVCVHNRTRAREEALALRGARRAATPAAAAEGAEIAFVMVADTPDVEAVVFGAGGVVEGLSPGALLIDMSTISPAATRAFAERLAERGGRWLDAPVSGGSEGAQRGTLSIMIGGDAIDVARAEAPLATLGSRLTHVGSVGSGQLVKAMNQVIIAGTYAAVAEGIVLGLKAGIDVEAALAAIGAGAAGSWGLTHRGPNVVADRYPLGFRLRLHRKDLGIALSAAREIGVPLPIAAWVEQIETGLIARGFGELDVSAIGRWLREQAGLPTSEG